MDRTRPLAAPCAGPSKTLTAAAQRSETPGDYLKVTAQALPPPNALPEGTATLKLPQRALTEPLVFELLGERATRFRCRGTWVIGTSAAASLRLHDPFVSGSHLRCTVRSDGVWVEDLGSKNGTRLNGIEIRAGLITPGMCLHLGRQRLLLFRQHPPRSSVPSVPETARRPGGMVGQSQSFQEAVRHLPTYAALEQPVLVLGETGVGKELVARALHDEGPRADAPFVALNCASIPEQLAESELFGHAKGAFTTALSKHRGAFARAGDGTLFLDEIGELPLALQAKLLRVLETRAFAPVGAEIAQPMRARIVAATHCDLPAAVERGTFREDLFHRLSVFQVNIPPLRARPDDISALLSHFVADTERQLRRQIRVESCAFEAAISHPWPGNIRALRNALLRAAVLGDGVITGALLVPRAAHRGEDKDGITVPRGDFATMKRALLRRLVEEHGSIRKAAVAIGVPRSTLGAWLRGPPEEVCALSPSALP